jgi:hypothetical protein
MVQSLKMMCDEIFNTSDYVKERPVFCATSSVGGYSGKACVAREQAVEGGTKQHPSKGRIRKFEIDDQNPR